MAAAGSMNSNPRKVRLSSARESAVWCEGIWARGEFNEHLTDLSLTPGPSPDGEGRVSGVARIKSPPPGARFNPRRYDVAPLAASSIPDVSPSRLHTL